MRRFFYYCITKRRFCFLFLPQARRFSLAFLNLSESYKFVAPTKAQLFIYRGGSSGGTDIIAMIINKYWPISPGKVYLYSDIFIIAVPANAPAAKPKPAEIQMPICFILFTLLYC